jgi:metallo-beta-lactamase class B
LGPSKAKDWVLLGLGTAAVLFFAVACPAWIKSNKQGGQQTAEPFHIAGNLYFVGATDVSIFLLTSPEGHVLIDGGTPGTPPLVIASMAKLGFDIKDVKLLLATEAHNEHAGGLAELQDSSGAKLWVSEPNADPIASGGEDPNDPLPLRIAARVGPAGYAVPRIDHRFKDGDTIRVGPITLTAHITPGHTRGCTTFSHTVREGRRSLRVVHACSLEILNMVRLADPQRPPGVREEFERSFRVLRSLPADVWVTNHGRRWGRYRKFSERSTDADSNAVFIDPQGYRAYVDSAEAVFRARLAEQQQKR